LDISSIAAWNWTESHMPPEWTIAPSGSSTPLPSVRFPTAALALVQWRAAADACALMCADNDFLIFA
jgi:hypothetical protein